MANERKKAILALADGTVFEGYSLGASGETTGEVVFNTSLTGYQEILTDPSYKGQLVTMTYPMQGNYGTNVEDVESRKPSLTMASGFIAKEPCDYPSNWRANEANGGQTLDRYLKENNIVGISGIDTRALTKRLREKGAMDGVISTVDGDIDEESFTEGAKSLLEAAKSLVQKAKALPGLVGLDLVKEVTCKESYGWTQGLWDITEGYAEQAPGTGIKKVVAMDFGIKLNILRNLVSLGCEVTVVPATTTADEILKLNPDGVFLSNGPGDPEPVTYAIETIKALIGKKPIFGICLGHQLLSLALGGSSYKLKFGHRGGNQPVKDLTTGKVEITSQNHGFAIDMDSIKGLGSGIELTHVNLNDNTVEGIADKERRCFSVQYHPEASPGPHDAKYLFKRFMEYMG